MRRHLTFRRSLLVCVLALSTLLGACAPDVVPPTTTDPNSTTTPGPTTTGPDGTPPTTLVPTVPDLSDLDVPEVVRDQLVDLMIKVQEIRGLAFKSTPTITVVDDAGLVDRIEDQLAESMEDVPADEALYKLLGLLPAGADLAKMITDMYTGSVAGFYDGENEEIVVPARPEGFSLLQQGTMIHELTHALTDQHFGFIEDRTEMADEQRYDEAAAFLALIEGDASLSEIHWMRQLTPRELGQYFAEGLAVDSSTLQSMPQFLRESLLFPYQSGLVFTQALHRLAGWAALNEAYQIMPGLPGSTEQVITPADFGRDLPIVIDPIPVEVEGYELVATSVWGELSFRLMFDQVLGESASFTASDGWGGDFYHQWFDGSKAALLLVYTGDTPDDIEEMRVALLDYRRKAIPQAAFVWVAVRGDRLFFIAADDPTVGAFLRTEMGLD